MCLQACVTVARDAGLAPQECDRIVLGVELCEALRAAAASGNRKELEAAARDWEGFAAPCEQQRRQQDQHM